MTAASPICSVAPRRPAERGWWTAVWPCEPIRSTSVIADAGGGGDGAARASANASPSMTSRSVSSDVSACDDAVDALAQRARKRRGHERARDQARVLAEAGDLAQRRVGAVGAGPRQQADDDAAGALAQGEQPG